MKVEAKVNFEGNYAVASDKLIKRCQCLQDMNFHLYQGGSSVGQLSEEAPFTSAIMGSILPADSK
jgi:hypothetical protein